MRSARIPDLFRGSAWYYARFRPQYPMALFAHISERFDLDGTGRLLDLGCGTGNLAIPLARGFEETVGMDPEPEMLTEAREHARRAGAQGISWVEGSSEHLTPEMGPFRLVTMGSSFHWMDRGDTLRALADMVVSDGGIAVVWGGSGETCWSEAVQTVTRRWLGDERRAGDGTYRHPEERHEEVIARSAFGRMETFESSYRHELDVESILGGLYSTSYCSIPVLGDKREPFERDLRGTLAEIEPSGQFEVEGRFEAILAWRDG